MLKPNSLNRKEFKQEELVHLKMDWFELSVAMPDNLLQLLIWTSELADHHHVLLIQKKQELELICESDIEKKQELNEQIKFYRKCNQHENQTKDFYLAKLLLQGDAIVKGYIQHETREDTKYAVVTYKDYNFITFAEPTILEKFPLHLINFERKKAPQTLAEIHENEEELLLEVKTFVKAFRAQYKKGVKKKNAIKEHNRLVGEIHKKINLGEVKLIQKKEKKPKEEPKPIAKSTPPTEKTPKPMMVIKKRKFNLVKD